MMNMKKLLALLLAIVMVVGMFPMGAMAEENGAEELCTCGLALNHDGECQKSELEPEPELCSCGLALNHDGECQSSNPAPQNVDEPELCNCGLAKDHEGDCQKTEPELCTCGLTKGHEGDCKAAEPELCDCGLTKGHEGDCKKTEPELCDCGLTKGHEGECKKAEETQCALCESTEHATNQCSLFCGFCQKVPCECVACTKCGVKNGHADNCELKPCEKCEKNPCACETEPTEETTVPTTVPEEVVLVEAELTKEVEGVSIKVSGMMPEGAVLEAKVPEAEVFEDEKFIKTVTEMIPERDYFSYVNFYDISILVNGEKWQPRENAVTVTFDNMNLTNGEKVEVYHILEDEEAIIDALEEETAQKIDLEEKPMMFKAVRKLFTSEHTINLEKEAYYTVNSSEEGDVTITENSISFETKSFSIYAVNGYNNESGKKLITANSTIKMKRGEVQYFKWEKPANVTMVAQDRGTWTVEAGDEYVDFEVYNSNLSADGSTGNNTNFYQYYWLKLTAKEPSGTEKATIQFEYVTNGNDGDDDNYIRAQEYFYVQVLETDDVLFIDDQIAENGCLVPTFTQETDTEGFTYEWARDDGETVNPVALEAPYAISDGAVNIAMDRGGIDAEDANTSTPMKTYTVTVKDGDNIIATAQYTVPYGNELLNGSFEYPKSVYVTHDYPNGAPGLYWKTTSESVRDNEVCQDIEILNRDRDFLQSNGISALEGTYGISKLAPGITYKGANLNYDDVVQDSVFPDGAQCAEINCDAPGALYQDILTYPGTSMYWQLSHRARNYSGSSAVNGGTWLPDGHSYTINGTTLTDQKDYMYVIAAPTAQVEHIKTQDQLNELIRAAGYPVNDFTVQKPTTQYHFDANGKEVTYNGIRFRIWEVATDHTAWKEYASSAPYEVGSGEYLTRFFFAAGSTSHDRARYLMGDGVNYSGGNFIDKVSFSDEMPWQIEYYKNGVLQSNLTESGMVDLNRDTMSYPLNKTASWNSSNANTLQGTTLVKTEINGRPYSGTTLGEVYTNHNILQLYYETYGVSITKQVEISNYDHLSNEERTQLQTILGNYSVKFKLYDSDNKEVATAQMRVDPETRYGNATFLDAQGNKFQPDTSEIYKIVEGDLPEVTGLVLKRKAADITGLTGSLVYAETAVNLYEMVQYGDLTITKEGAQSIDENQSFLFRVTGPDSFTMDVAVVGNDSVTIKHLPVGTYKVVELTDWSWRYEQHSVSPTDGEVTLTYDNPNQTVTFTNNREKIYWLSGDSYAQNWWNGNQVQRDPVFSSASN